MVIIFRFFPTHFFHHPLSKPFLPCSPRPEQPHPLPQPILPITFPTSSEMGADPPPTRAGGTPGRAGHAAEVRSQPRGRRVPTPALRGVPLTPLPFPQRDLAIPQAASKG